MTPERDRTGPIGRVVRIVAGIAFLALFFRTLTGFPLFVGFVTPTPPGIWVGVALSLYFFADVINIGFARAWGRWPQVVLVLLGLGAVVFDLAQFGSVWGPPLGLLVFLLLVYVTGHLGLSFIVAGVVATPG